MDQKAHCEIVRHCEESHYQLYEIKMPQVNKIVTIYIYNKHKETVEVHTLYFRCRENPSVISRVRFREIYFIGNIYFVLKNVSAI